MRHENAAGDDAAGDEHIEEEHATDEDGGAVEHDAEGEEHDAAEEHDAGEDPDRRGVLRALAGLAILLGGLYLSGWLFLGGSVPDGTEVADVEIGGLDPDDAEYRLATELADRLEQPILLDWQGHRFELDPEQAGLRLDIEATVEQAGGGRSWNPMRMLDTLLSTDHASPVIDVDRKALDAALAEIAAKVDQPPAEPRVMFGADGRRDLSFPVSGHTIDREGVADDIVAAYLRTDKPIQLRLDAVEPTTGVGDLNQALTSLAAPATSGPIQLRLPHRTVQLTVPEFAPALILRGENGAVAPSFDVDRLRQTMAGLSARINTPPRSARVVLRNGRPAVVTSTVGRRLDPARVAAAVAPVLTETGPARSAKVGMSPWQAPFTTQDARKLGIRRIVSSATTYYPHAVYRNVNLRRAASRINGTVLWPGETFSFQDVVGWPSRARGFVPAPVLTHGMVVQRFRAGVSQLATTAFNAAFFAGLEDVWHRPHGFYVDRYPEGRDAMVAWPGVDLRFKNNTPYGVLIQAWTRPSTPKRPGQVQVRMWSTKHWDITSGKSGRHHFRKPGVTVDRTRPCQAHPGQPGFDVEVQRYFRRHGTSKLHHKETMRASYEPTDRVVCRIPRDRPRGRGR